MSIISDSESIAYVFKILVLQEIHLLMRYYHFLVQIIQSLVYWGVRVRV